MKDVIITDEEREIGTRIATLRDAIGISIQDFADKLELSADAIKRIESGKSNKQYSKLLRIAEVLHVTPNDILVIPTDHISRAALRGALEASYIALGRTEAESVALARIVLEVLDRSEFRSSGLSREDIARVLAEDRIRQFFASKRR